VQVTFGYPGKNSRLFAIPFIGGLLRIILLIPHLIVLYILGFVVELLSFVVLSLIALFTGKIPQWGYTLVGGFIRWNTRLQAYFFGLTDKYPPFGFGD
jgi:hypothetical protein